jgi:hypothetical protein
MKVYWGLLSEDYQKKLRRLAECEGVSINKALFDIVDHIKTTNCLYDRPLYFHDVVTIRQVEEVIEQVMQSMPARC